MKKRPATKAILLSRSEIRTRKNRLAKTLWELESKSPKLDDPDLEVVPDARSILSQLGSGQLVLIKRTTLRLLIDVLSQ